MRTEEQRSAAPGTTDVRPVSHGDGRRGPPGRAFAFATVFAVVVAIAPGAGVYVWQHEQVRDRDASTPPNGGSGAPLSCSASDILAAVRAQVPIAEPMARDSVTIQACRGGYAFVLAHPGTFRPEPRSRRASRCF